MELSELTGHVIEGKTESAEEWTRKAISEGMDPLVIVNEGLIAGMEVVGERFTKNEYYVPEMLVSAKAMKASLALVKPLLAQQAAAATGQVVIGTVAGDLHDIGKNLVAMMLEGAGFEVTDLGIDVSPQAFVEAVERNEPDLLCLSALLTTTMPMIERTIGAMKEAELRQKVKIMVGGASMTDDYASSIGADGFAPDAVSAVVRARELMGITSR